MLDSAGDTLAIFIPQSLIHSIFGFFILKRF